MKDKKLKIYDQIWDSGGCKSTLLQEGKVELLSRVKLREGGGLEFGVSDGKDMHSLVLLGFVISLYRGSRVNLGKTLTSRGRLSEHYKSYLDILGSIKVRLDRVIAKKSTEELGEIVVRRREWLRCIQSIDSLRGAYGAVVKSAVFEDDISMGLLVGGMLSYMLDGVLVKTSLAELWLLLLELWEVDRGYVKKVLREYKQSAYVGALQSIESEWAEIDSVCKGDMESYVDVLVNLNVSGEDLEKALTLYNAKVGYDKVRVKGKVFVDGYYISNVGEVLVRMYLAWVNASNGVTGVEYAWDRYVGNDTLGSYLRNGVYGYKGVQGVLKLWSETEGKYALGVGVTELGLTSMVGRLKGAKLTGDVIDLEELYQGGVSFSNKYVQGWLVSEVEGKWVTKIWDRYESLKGEIGVMVESQVAENLSEMTERATELLRITNEEKLENERVKLREYMVEQYRERLEKVGLDPKEVIKGYDEIEEEIESSDKEEIEEEIDDSILEGKRVLILSGVSELEERLRGVGVNAIVVKTEREVQRFTGNEEWDFIGVYGRGIKHRVTFALKSIYKGVDLVYLREGNVNIIKEGIKKSIMLRRERKVAE